MTGASSILGGLRLGSIHGRPDEHSRLVPGAPARRDRQGRDGQVDRRRGARARRSPPRARTCCSARSRAARASPGCSTSTRCRPRSAGSRPGCTATTGPPASSTRCTSTPSRRCWSTSRSTTSSAAQAGRSTASASSSSRPRSHRACGRAAHRQGLRGGPAQQSQQGGEGVRRRRARRPADRSDHAVPQRQRGALRPGEGRPDQEPVGHGDDPLPRRAPRSTW